MKGNICALLVFFLVAGTLGADSNRGKISDLIRQDLFRNAGKIEENSRTLTDMERFTLYSHFEKDARLPFVTNLAIGFGLGAFVQGDTAGAVTRIFESIRPFSYARRYNTTLRKSLRYSDSPSLSLIPSSFNKGITLVIRLPMS